MKKSIGKMIIATLVVAALSGNMVFAEEINASNQDTVSEYEGETSSQEETEGEEELYAPDGEEDDKSEDDNIEKKDDEEEIAGKEDLSGLPQKNTLYSEGSQQEDHQIYELQYRVHVQTYGWQNWTNSGNVAGTTGESKRLEAIEIRIVDEDGNPSENLHVEYRVHVQTYGWQDWAADGQTAGTTGLAKRLEAVQIRLTGEESQNYILDYKTHIQTLGWMDYAQDQELSGSEGFGKRMEAIQICIAPSSDGHKETNGRSFLREYNSEELSFSGHVQTYGDVSGVSNGQILGTTGQAKRIEGIKIHLDTTSEEVAQGNIQYAAHIQSYGWSDFVNNEIFNGTVGQAKRLEAIKIKLSGEIAEYYDVYYRVHVQSYGWMAWTLNGRPAGTEGFGKRMEAVQIKLVMKGNSAPGTAGDSFYNRNDMTALVAKIKQYVNCPYRFGGTTPLGWDCSGCVQWIYKNIFNISLPRTARQQATVGKSVSISNRSSWKVGDLLCYGSRSGVTHVGIYLGNNNMIHALNSKYGTKIHNVDWYEKWDSGNSLVDVRRIF